MYTYHHIGIPTKEKRESMHYFPEFKLWETDYESTEFRIEWIYFEKDCPLHPLIQTIPHISFTVNDLNQALQDKRILMKPIVYEGVHIAFIEEEGAPIQLLQLPE